MDFFSAFSLFSFKIFSLIDVKKDSPSNLKKGSLKNPIPKPSHKIGEILIPATDIYEKLIDVASRQIPRETVVQVKKVVINKSV